MGNTAPTRQGMRTRGVELWLRSFDDLVEGDSFVSRGRTITEADLVQFAAITGDWHPQHTDAEWAAESMFGQRIAHGMLVISYAIGLLPLEQVVALRRMKHLIFKHPVFIGDTIRVEGRVMRLLPFSDEVGLLSGRWNVVNQDGKTCMKADIDALWRRSVPEV